MRAVREKDVSERGSRQRQCARVAQPATWRPSAAASRSLPAFTLVELIVVITVIVLVLAIAVPGLSALNAQARLVSAQQIVNGLMTRAYYLALADRTMTAVRFFPGDWDSADTVVKHSTAGVQNMAVYSYVGTTARENPPGSGTFQVTLGEYFERTKDVASVALPDDVWAAPLESLRRSGQIGRSDGTSKFYTGNGSDTVAQQFVLNGQMGQFRYNADRWATPTDGTDFLNACPNSASAAIAAISIPRRRA